MPKVTSWLGLAIGLPLMLAIEYLMAMAGEPRALWLMRDVLGLVQ